MLAESTVWEIVRDPGNFFFIVVIGVPVLCFFWFLRGAARDSLNVKHAELMLKQSMIERGMSADEIERVLAAGSGDAGSIDADE